jgi:hypothetical protein
MPRRSKGRRRVTAGRTAEFDIAQLVKLKLVSPVPLREVLAMVRFVNVGPLVLVSEIPGPLVF